MFGSIEISEVARNWAIVVGGAIGLGLAFWRGLAANRQARASLAQVDLARRDHVTELFGKAVEHLGHERLEIRLGAIYTLKQIGEDFADFSTPIFELLAAYVRERSVEVESKEPPPDIKEIMLYLHQCLIKE